VNEITAIETKSKALTQAEAITLQARRADQNPALVYLRAMTPKARRVQANALNTIARLINPALDLTSVNWELLEYQHAQAIRAELIERYSPASVNRMLSALRGVAKQAWLMGLASPEQYFRVNEVGNVKGETLPAGRALTSGEISALMQTCIIDQTPAGFRDAAIIAVLAVAGLRRNELVSLNLADFDPESGALKILHGKGNKQRKVFLDNGAAEALADWLILRGNEPGALFLPINKAGKLTYKQLTDQAIYNMLKKRASQAGVSQFTPHDLRRTCITNLLEADVDTLTVAAIAGHASTDTTRGYDRRPEAAKQRAAKRLHIPYKRRLG